MAEQHGNLWLFVHPGMMLASLTHYLHQGCSTTLFPSSSFLYCWIFICALFLPCTLLYKSYWYSGSAPSQTSKPLLILHSIPSHGFPVSICGSLDDSLGGTVSNYSLLSSPIPKVLFCSIFSGSTFAKERFIISLRYPDLC